MVYANMFIYTTIPSYRVTWIIFQYIMKAAMFIGRFMSNVYSRLVRLC